MKRIVPCVMLTLVVCLLPLFAVLSCLHFKVNAQERVISIVDAKTGESSISLGSPTEPMPPGGYPFTVNVTLNGLTQNLFVFQVAIAYKYEEVKCTGAWLPKNDPNFVFYNKQILPAEPVIYNQQPPLTAPGYGYVVIGASLINWNDAVTTSQAILCQINFTVLKTGTTTLNIIPTRPEFPDTFLWNTHMNEIDFSPQDFQVSVYGAKCFGTVYIRADGSIDPPDAPIITYDNVTYMLYNNIISLGDGIVIERDNIVVDGASYTVQGTTDGKGIVLSGRSNVTLKNVEIKSFLYGILIASSKITVYRCNLVSNTYGIYLFSGSNNTIFENNFSGCGLCVLEGSHFNVVYNNTVNNKPLVYLEDVTGYNVSDAGQVVLVNCDNIKVEKLDLSDTSIGVELLRTNNTRIIQNIINSSACGIYGVRSSNNIILGNTITNSYDGIFLTVSTNTVISGNSLTNNTRYGIQLLGHFNSVYGNNITNNYLAVGLGGTSSQNSISRNNIINNTYGIELGPASQNNTVSGNSIIGTKEFAIGLNFAAANRICDNNIVNNGCGIGLHASCNSIYHNNFINNIRQTQIYGGKNNTWDDGYPSGGNYWSDYTGVDFYSGPYQNETGSDSLGDASYFIDANNTDRYPLMAPFSTFEAGVWDGIAYNVDVVSNSTVSDFKFSVDQKSISFNVSGDDGTVGFCRIVIPNFIVQELWKGNYTVLLNGEPYPFKNWTDSENTYIYINYTHSTHEIVIIPEFPSTTILTIFMLTTTIPVVLTRNRRSKHRR